ncbi:MAG: hypothetical protein ACPGPE_04800 [Planctomycetota bacterium]
MGIGGYMSVEALRLLSRFNPEGILLLIFGVAIFCVPFKQLLDL